MSQHSAVKVPSVSTDVRSDVYQARDILREASPQKQKGGPKKLEEELTELKQVFAKRNY